MERVAPMFTSQPEPRRRALSQDAVRLRAYFKWQAAGRPEGDGIAFWLQAERELQGK
jgi:hypothetical protein